MDPTVIETVPGPGGGRVAILLVRHGESDWNLARRTQGQSMEPELTERGRAQAHQAAARIAAALPPGAGVRVIGSDLTRAWQSAQIIADHLGVEAVSEIRLREQHLGALEGLGYEESWALAQTHDWSDPHLPVAGGESPAQVYARMREVLVEVNTSPVPVVLVSHGEAIRAALAFLNGHGPAEGPWVEVPNGAVVLVRRTGDAISIEISAQ